MYPRTTLSFLTTGYLKLCHFFESLKSPFLLIIRLYWGWQFFQTGLGKLSDIEHVTSFFESLGIPYPMHNAYLVGSVETIGGACLFLGFADRFHI